MNSSADYDVAQLKLPPHSLEAEQSVLGALMIANDSWDKIADMLTADDFYRPEHRIIFQRMAQLVEANQPIDIVTLPDALTHADELDRAGGFVYLAEIARNTPSAANIRAYAIAVRERATLRKMIQVGQEIADAGYNPDGRRAAELIDEAQAAVFTLSESGASVGRDLRCEVHLRSLLDEWQRRSECDGLIGLSTGFDALDRRTNGLNPGDLIILAARPSMGKTSLAMNIAEHVAVDQKKPVLVFSMEMTAEQLLDRMAASVGRIPYDLIRTGKVFGHDEYDSRILPTVNTINSAPLFIDDRPALTIAQMRATARKEHKRNPLGLIVVDYLQLARAKAESRVMEVTYISQGLKALAKELRVPVLALSQLNRSVDSRSDKRPNNSDLRDSGAIEQDADVIWFIYRDEVYNETSPQKGVAEIICTKQRNGPTGTDYLATNLAQCRFDDLARGYAPPEQTPPVRRSFEY